jgi:hypothetical protein
MSSTNTLRRSRWSWFAVLATAIVCACGGGHDATTGPETLHKEAYASGDLGTCPVVQLTATGTGTTTTTSRYDYHYGPNGHEELFFTFPPTITVSSGQSTGYNLVIGLPPQAPKAEGPCIYTSSDALTFSGSCNYSLAIPWMTLSLEPIGSGGNVAVTLDLGGLPIDDGNPCTADACAAGGGVTHTALPSPNATINQAARRAFSMVATDSRTAELSARRRTGEP